MSSFGASVGVPASIALAPVRRLKSRFDSDVNSAPALVTVILLVSTILFVGSLVTLFEVTRLLATVTFREGVPSFLGETRIQGNLPARPPAWITVLLTIWLFRPPPIEKNYKQFFFQITTVPNDGLYEFTLVSELDAAVSSNDYEYREETIAKMLVNVNSISRINMYGDQPKCIYETFPHLRKYCFCK